MPFDVIKRPVDARVIISYRIADSFLYVCYVNCFPT